MKYRQRIVTALGLGAVCFTLLLFLGPAGFREIQILEWRTKQTAPSLKIHPRRPGRHFYPKDETARSSAGAAAAHLSFMRKDLDLSNYTGDITNAKENSSEVLFSPEKHRDRADHVINSVSRSEKNHDEPSYDTQDTRLLSQLRDTLTEDDTFRQEANVDNLIYLADIIRHGSKADHVLTKTQILKELAAKLQAEGNLIAQDAIPTSPPEIAGPVALSDEEWSAINRVRPNTFSKKDPKKKGRGPLLNIYPRPKK